MGRHYNWLVFSAIIKKDRDIGEQVRAANSDGDVPNGIRRCFARGLGNAHTMLAEIAYAQKSVPGARPEMGRSHLPPPTQAACL